MTERTNGAANWFEQGGEAYARYRPHYPAALRTYLQHIAPQHHHALDVGCGSGQLTRQLAQVFERVTGLDPSAQQIANAPAHAGIDYRVAPAEQLPADLHDIDLITVAQAAHWFDLPAFYAEVRRIAAPGAAIALISYGVLQTDLLLADRFQRFYAQEVGPWWPPERRLVDSGYADIDFPFSPLAAPEMTIDLTWDRDAFLGYISTWSAVKQAREHGQQPLLMQFYADINALWGDPARTRLFRWPVAIRAGRI